MRGYVTELDFALCEQVFPGIINYYRKLEVKPSTFLELVWEFTHRLQEPDDPIPVASLAASGAR
jgi:hypothetical protein